ncbi:hypothetical protein [Peribacillus loiseleuriae]|uniref:NERD domain-containing protein n=1 Tax=Peribacillus loiseleuriae TaxID=1679170 RepID=A0A0K9GTV3_9BACI|nr:hypothetical protein [Peribacillus loiseleuriae]KMY50114.1 hypothetical protein AC625_11890 [Peribacillus loiseleuriae]
MIKVVNDVDILLVDERREFEEQVLILAYRNKVYFHKLILVDLRMVIVVGQIEPSWIYVIKQVGIEDYRINRASYCEVVREIHSRVESYLEETYGGKFSRYILADHEYNVYVQLI